MNMKKSAHFYELLTTFIFLILGIVFLFESLATKQHAPVGQLSSMDFPRTIVILIIGVSIYLIVRNLLANKYVFQGFKEVLDETDKRIWISCALIIMYALAWNYLSFLISTFLYFVVQAKVIDKSRKIKQCILVAFCATVAIYLVFSLVFNIRFPEVILTDVLGLHL